MPTTAPSENWKLIWSDEFDHDGRPDPNTWTYEQGFLRNRELQWYQPENAWCEGGCLIIEGRRVHRANPRFEAGSTDWIRGREFIEYTSASLKTQRLREWQYGRLEVRAKIQTKSGLWPAIWTLGVNGRWPANGEVDVMEYYKDQLLANVAWGSSRSRNGEWVTRTKPVADYHDPQWDQRFHTWRMDWDEKRIRLSVDDLVLNDTDLTKTINPDGTNPFHQPHYLILNLAIGGRNGGDPTDTPFPTRYVIDYVRVYQVQR
jgi:beta-glucanase (GH16 family)